MSENDIEKIEPVDFDASNSPVLAPVQSASANSKPSVWVWLGLGSLLVVALAVIFVLPALVTEYELPLERRVDVSTPAVTATSASSQIPGNAVSPFTEAQRALQRKEAQDVLSELLAVQAELDELEVEAWAETSYQEALGMAQQGDQVYLEQDFTSARDSYQNGLNSLQALLDSVPTVLGQYLVDGEAALAINDSSLAIEKFTVATKLDFTNMQAREGLERAGNLDEVNAILADAEALRESGDLQAALEQYAAALDLDSNNALARQQFDQASQQLLQQQFAGVMSEGFSLLQDDRPEQAIEAFERAARLGINRGQAEAAIQQTTDAVARVDIERLRNQATDAQKDEQWPQAMSAFEQVLEIDSNLVFAVQGLDYSSKRQRLDQLLEGAIANPERFADDEVYQQTLDIFYTGQAIEESGPRLQSQLDRLQVLLEQSQVPISINLISDTATKVVLLGIAEFDPFESTILSLKPGRYVAVGTRLGYRDVRQEFLVGFGQTPDAVTVICEEEIVASRGR